MPHIAFDYIGVIEGLRDVILNKEDEVY